MGLSAVLLNVLGGALLLVVLTDLFLALLYPAGRGLVSDPVMRIAWALTRRAGRRVRAVSGALAVVSAILSWILLAVLAGALLLGPHLPEGFSYSAGLDPERGPWLDAVYVSAVTLTTLGFGDVVPTAGGLRLLVPVLAFTGFALLTAAVTWVMQLYPALTRRRALALRLAGLKSVGTVGRLPGLDPVDASGLLTGLATGLDQVRIDLTQYAETYYFHEGDDDASLPAHAAVALRLAESAARSDHPSLRHAGELLEHSVTGLSTVLDDDFLHVDGSPAEVLEEWRRRHS